MTELFTAKERDQESGLDYFLARYYSGVLGRFTGVDPMVHPGASEVGEAAFLSDPQRWNKYAYTRSSPLRYVDPDGYELTVAAEVQQTVGAKGDGAQSRVKICHNSAS